MQNRMSPALRCSARSSKDDMPLESDSGTTRTTLFSRKFTRVALSTKSRPSVLTAGSASISSWFICFWPAEMNTSQSAPSWIWVLSVPEESKFIMTVTFGFAAIYMSATSVRVSVMEAAAKTMISTGSASDSGARASSATCSSEAAGAAVCPQAARVKSMQITRVSADNFFIFQSPSLQSVFNYNLFLITNCI